MKISLVLPTRGRPMFMKKTWESAYKTAKNKHNLEICFRIDEDDDDSISMYNKLQLRYHYQIKAFIGKRGDGILSQFWNEAVSIATGEILHHCGDDLRFRTDGWDTLVINEFKKYKDKIALVYGDDGIRRDDLATHGFIHKNWVNVVGYFLPPYFSSDWNDYWLTDVARRVGRLNKIDIYTEHLHPSVGKHDWDKTHQERMERGSRDKVSKMYREKQNERNADAQTLKDFISSVENSGLEKSLNNFTKNVVEIKNDNLNLVIERKNKEVRLELKRKKKKIKRRKIRKK